MDPVREQKKALRGRMTAALREMGEDARAEASDRLTALVWKQKRFTDARMVFCYLSMPEEVRTQGIIRRCLAEGKAVAVPRVVSETGRIEARRLDPAGKALVPGPFGILEPDPVAAPLVRPDEIDCVIVPGLAFDVDGWRLGRGKGYYDRFLAALGPSAARIAPAFELQRVDRVPREPHDQKMDQVLFA